MKRRSFLVALLLPAIAQAHSTKHGNIAIGHSWALPSRQNDGQVFFPLINEGTGHDELVAARSDICAAIELRRNNRYDDPALTSIGLEPNKPIPMRPTDRHLRLVGLRKPLVAGDSFKIILDFLNAGEAAIEVIVETKPGD